MSEACEKRPIDLFYEKIEAGGLESLTSAERWLFALTWLGLETNSGGLHQFFFNDAGKFAADALLGLEAIGALKSAEVLRRAIALFPGGHVPVDETERRRVLNKLPQDVQWKRLGEDLTREFWAACEDDQWAQLASDYIASHRELFPVLQQ
jgi:hypothetical protein